MVRSTEEYNVVKVMVFTRIESAFVLHMALLRVLRTTDSTDSHGTIR